MSWSVEKIGTAAKVKDAVAADLERAAAGYDSSNPAEAADIRTAKERILATLEALDMAPNAYAPGSTPLAKVSASGSRSSGYLSLSISVGKVDAYL